MSRSNLELRQGPLTSQNTANSSMWIQLRLCLIFDLAGATLSLLCFCKTLLEDGTDGTDEA